MDFLTLALAKKMASGGGTGGGGIFWVNVRQDYPSDGIDTLDKTAGEIASAIDAGMAVLLANTATSQEGDLSQSITAFSLLQIYGYADGYPGVTGRLYQFLENPDGTPFYAIGEDAYPSTADPFGG